MIVEQLIRQGTMLPERLYEPPFTGLHYEGIDGVFSAEEANRVVQILRFINYNADSSEAAA